MDTRPASDAEAKRDFLGWIERSLGDAEAKKDFLQGQADAELITEQLKVWFAFKLKGEQQRHTVGHHMSDYDEVFNETDRIVAAVLSLRCPTSANVPGMCLCTSHDSISNVSANLVHCQVHMSVAWVHRSCVIWCIAQFHEHASWSKHAAHFHV